MITRLFSIFEPSSRIIRLSFNWVSVFLGFICMPYLYWVVPSRWTLLWSKVIQTLHGEFKVLLGSNFSRRTIIFIRLFTFIVYNNFLGLIPYVFTGTRHLALTLALSLPLWFTFIIFGWINHTQHIFAHLVPQGTPGLLIPFIVIIETIRNVIRPGTLAIRLAANMIAGHLLLALLGGAGSGLRVTLVVLLVLSQNLLLILEAAVAIIQSYVFAVLRTIYAREVN